MTLLTPQAPDAQLGRIIKLAVMAVGGQGGGVLTGWIEALGRAGGYAVQATSVAGVAQRTGATIYYIEMAPMSDPAPVFALAPAAGDVDILVAAEMMEAGRAILRGFVTPDRTVLIASTHRALAVSEKTVPGDGIADAAEVRAAAEVAAQRFIAFDMERIATEAGSVISASLFGALAGSGALPFAREAYVAAIEASGRGVAASLAAFEAARRQAEAGEGAPVAAPAPAPARPGAPAGPARLRAGWDAAQARVAALPAEARDMALAGLRKVVDFQDLAYGADYLARVEAMAALDRADKGHVLTREAAKYIANAMVYDDIIRVADLKTRGDRPGRIAREMGAGQAQVLQVTEFLHPRAEEIAGLMPAAMGRRAEAAPGRMALLGRLFGGGKRIRSDRLGGFVVLYALGGLRWWRRRTLRHAQEVGHLESWLALTRHYLAGDYDLAVEVLRCRRLVKGYSDTQARGLSKYDRVTEGIALVAGRGDAADWARRLREAALKDEEGKALDGALATIRSFV